MSLHHKSQYRSGMVRTLLISISKTATEETEKNKMFFKVFSLLRRYMEAFLQFLTVTAQMSFLLLHYFKCYVLL